MKEPRYIELQEQILGNRELYFGDNTYFRERTARENKGDSPSSAVIQHIKCYLIGPASSEPANHRSSDGMNLPASRRQGKYCR